MSGVRPKKNRRRVRAAAALLLAAGALAACDRTSWEPPRPRHDRWGPAQPVPVKPQRVLPSSAGDTAPGGRP